MGSILRNHLSTPVPGLPLAERTVRVVDRAGGCEPDTQRCSWCGLTSEDLAGLSAVLDDVNARLAALTGDRP